MDKLAVLNDHPLFKSINQAMTARVAARALPRLAEGGSMLYRRGDEGASLHLLLSGAIRLSARSKNGKNTVLNIMFPGDVFGELAFLDGGCHIADAVAMENSSLLIIQRRDFLPVLHAYPGLAVRLIEMLCGRLRLASGQMEDISFLDLSQRLAKALLHLHSRGQLQDKGETVRISQLQLSQLAGGTRESTNRRLSHWHKMNIIGIERNNIVVRRPEALLKLAAA